MLLERVGPSLQKDLDIVLAAIRQNPEAFQFVHPSLQNNTKVLLEMATAKIKSLAI